MFVYMTYRDTYKGREEQRRGTEAGEARRIDADSLTSLDLNEYVYLT